MEAIKLANTHPRVNIHLPGPGVGGPCLPKEPYFLIYKSKPPRPNLIATSRKINDYMPSHIIETILTALEKAGKNIKTAKIAVLGTAYKKNVDDSRLSPAQPIIKTLLKLGLKTVAYDPKCEESFGAEKAESLDAAAKKADCILILTDHKKFKHLRLNEIRQNMNPNPIIVDTSRVIDKDEATKLGFKYYGLGNKSP